MFSLNFCLFFLKFQIISDFLPYYKLFKGLMIFIFLKSCFHLFPRILFISKIWFFMCIYFCILCYIIVTIVIKLFLFLSDLFFFAFPRFLKHYQKFLYLMCIDLLFVLLFYNIIIWTLFK